MDKFAKRKNLLEHLKNLKNAGVELCFELVSEDGRTRRSVKRELNVGMGVGSYINHIYIAPDSKEERLLLTWQYAEMRVPREYDGPRIIVSGLSTQGTSYLTLSNKIQYKFFHNHPSWAPDIHPSFRSDAERSLDAGETFDFKNLKT